jgi:hypothetical protein
MQLLEDKDLPVLFLIFNRTAETSRVFEAIRNLAPRKLFIAADGPRASSEKDREACEETRRICSDVDWECDVSRLYSSRNLGCKRAVSQAISWFFGNVQAGVILEDDCLPSPSFFTFCREMLVRYWDVEAVMQVSGTCYLGDRYSPKNDYYFSALNDIWGWATWRRAWSLFDLSMPGYIDFKSRGGIRSYMGDARMAEWLTLYLDDALNEDASVWSSQWAYAIAKAGGLTINPARNLVTNIGFDSNGTHCSAASWRYYDVFKAGQLTVNSHPSRVERDVRADRVRFDVIRRTDPRCRLRFRIQRFLYVIARFIKNRLLGASLET